MLWELIRLLPVGGQPTTAVVAQTCVGFSFVQCLVLFLEYFFLWNSLRTDFDHLVNSRGTLAVHGSQFEKHWPTVKLFYPSLYYVFSLYSLVILLRTMTSTWWAVNIQRHILIECSQIQFHIEIITNNPNTINKPTKLIDLHSVINCISL
jgi:hypothetical protein